MCVEWISIYIAFMLIELILKVNVDELCWNWLNYMLLLRNGELVMNVDKVIVMCFVIEKRWIEVNMNDLFDNWLILCIVVEKLWIWYMMRWGFRYWVVDDWKNDLNHGDCGLEIVDMHWSDELCELLVFDGNELVV